MRHILLAAVIALLPTWVWAAEQSGQPPKKPAAAPRPVNSCAAYGAGFVKVEGSSTCVKIGGSMTIDVGGRIGR